MTKAKSNTAVGLINGSMAVAKQAAKVRTLTRKRHFLVKNSTLGNSTQVLSSTQSPYPVGSQFSAETLLFGAVELQPNAIQWIQSHDKYRIAQVEIFATLVSRSKDGGISRTTPVEIYFYEDTDADPSTLTSWIRVADRDNVGRVVLNAFTPSMRLATFKPTVTYAANTGSQNPSNAIPSKSQWLDALAVDQLYSGLRVFTACPQVDTQGQSYDYSVAFTTRYTVEASQPI